VSCWTASGSEPGDWRERWGAEPSRWLLTSARMTEDDLDRLSSKELHDLSVSRARRHADIKFFWELLKVMPAAEAAAGRLEEAEADITSVIARVDDLTDAGEGEVAEALRPFYLDYLRRHDVKAP
jgi:hypothetical protein